MRSHRASTALAALAVLLGVLLGAPDPAGSAPARRPWRAATWAPADTATVHPGVMMFTDGAQCTANFVFADKAGDVYLGYAAHCAGTGAATETNGCDSGSLPLGTPVEIDGATRPGTLVYSSWLAMQAVGETDEDACNYNDLALVRIDPADIASVNPSVPHWGGPTGIDTDGIAAGEQVHSYGNSSLRLGVTELSPKTGISLGTEGNGWSHPVYTLTPGIPGDSGSALLDATGQAAGVLSTIAIAPLAGSNNFGALHLELAYVAAHGGPSVRMAPGTEPFDGAQLPVG